MQAEQSLDLSNKKHVQRLEERAKLSKDAELNDLRYVLNDERGRRFLWKTLSFCGIFKTSFTGNSHTFFNEGQRNVGLVLFNDIMNASSDAYTQMVKEAQLRAEKEEKK